MANTVEAATLLDSKTLEITGISIQLKNPLDHPLYIKLGSDETELLKVLERKTSAGKMTLTLDPPLCLPEGSTLTVLADERHRVRKWRDKALAEISLPFSNIWQYLQSRGHDHPMKYPVYDTDPNMQIWLDVAATPTPPQTDLNSQDKTTPIRPNFSSSSRRLPDSVKTPPSSATTFRFVIHKSLEHKSALEHLGRARGTVEALFKAGNIISELHPIAKLVMECVNVVYDQLKEQDQCHEQILSLAESMARTVEYLEPVKKIARLDLLRQTMESLPPLMQETADFIEESTSKSVVADFFLTPSNKEKIDSLKKRHDIFTEEFHRGIEVDAAVKTNSLLELQDDKLLRERLLEGINFSPRTEECMEDTRVNILEEVDARVNRTEERNLIWITGFPGVGKSALAATIISRLQDRGRFVSYFRFDRAKPASATSNALWRRVAYDLARRYPSVRECILEQFKADAIDASSPDVVKLFASLIEEPLSKPTDVPSGQLPVIVVDALDECGGLDGRRSKDRKGLLATLKRWAGISRKFKLIATSRPEDDITSALSRLSITINIPSGQAAMEDLQTQTQASSDIRTFFVHRFREIAKGSAHLPPDWPGDNAIDDLTHHAAGIFIWATTVANFIEDGNPPSRLAQVMGHGPDSSDMAGLYLLYSDVLKMSFGYAKPYELEALNCVIGAMVYAERPLSDTELTKLPKVDVSMLEFIRNGLRSVLGPGDTLSFSHQSFVDFLLSDKCPAELPIKDSEAEHQRRLTELCLSTMREKLCFNICGLETSTIKENIDIPDLSAKIEKGISSLLSYSCCFWANHLVRAPFSESLMAKVKNVVYDQLLYWFEVMSLLKKMNWVPPILRMLLDWSAPEKDNDFSEFVTDAQRFIGVFGYPIAQSVPHIYLSALPFAPELSVVAKRFLPRYPKTITITTGRSPRWPPFVFASEHHKNFVMTVAFSPDRKHFISGSRDGTVCICDVETGNLVLGPLTGSGKAKNVAFRSDGQCVATGYDDGSVCVWDAESGDKLLYFKEHKKGVAAIAYLFKENVHQILSASSGKIVLWDVRAGTPKHISFEDDRKYITAIAFSPDGRYMASGSDDGYISIWNVEDGTRLQGPLRSGEATEVRVETAAFSPDSRYVATGSRDCTVRFWCVETGGCVGTPMVASDHWIQSVAYSPDGRLLVSACGKTVMVWDTTTHDPVLEPLVGHTDWVRAVSVSADGRKILSGSEDRTVRMWDLDRKEVLGQPEAVDSHVDSVMCVAFSPCGRKLVSGSRDKTVRVWDSTTGEPLLEPIKGHTQHVQKVAFSPDGNRIASSSWDCTMRICDAEMGKLVYERHLPPVLRGRWDLFHGRRLFFRRTDQRLVISCANEVRMFGRSEAEDRPSKPFRSYLKCIAISPDGSSAILYNTRPVEGSGQTLEMWSTAEPKKQLLKFKLRGNPKPITHAAYSYNGKYAVSSNTEGVLQVWNTKTGDMVGSPFGDKHDVLHIIFSPLNDYLIALASDSDRAIRIWDTRTPRLAAGPWYGHESQITDIVFSPNGNKLASCSLDGMIRIWDTSNLAQPASPCDITVGYFRDEWRIENGWVIDNGGEKLFWVPHEYRSGLWRPRSAVALGRPLTKMDLASFKHGQQWQECTKCFDTNAPE